MQLPQGVAPRHQAQRRASRLARFGKDQRAAVEVERGETDALRHGLPRWMPAQPAGNHQVQHHEELVGKLDDHLLGETTHGDYRPANQLSDRGRDGTQQKRARQAHAFQFRTQ